MACFNPKSLGALLIVVLGVACRAAPAERPNFSQRARQPSEPPRLATSSEATRRNARGSPSADLRVGASFDYAPFSVRDSDGKEQGFDEELAQLLARDLGLEIEWVTFRWPTLQAQVEHQDFDVAMSGVTWQPARAIIGSMTRTVARGGPCLLGDANATRVAVNRGGVLEAWSRAHLAVASWLRSDAARAACQQKRGRNHHRAGCAARRRSPQRSSVELR